MTKRTACLGRMINFNQDEFIFVRGIPVLRSEVYMHQQRLGAQLFDESMFCSNDVKRYACATVVRELDIKLGVVIASRRYPLNDNEITLIDIGDPSWVYIPVSLFGKESPILTVPSKDKPAGLVAWFRMRKQY